MVDDRSEAPRPVRIDDLRGCLAIAFKRLGLAPGDAEGLGGLLVDSELRGHPDHGVAALAVLVPSYRDGTLNPRPRVRALRETDGALLLDGDGGCGPGAPTRAMRWCIERARERSGMAAAAVRDWQIVVGAPYARLAAEAGLIGFSCANFVPQVAPPGGRTAVFGTNPVAYGLPGGCHHPVVLDIATPMTTGPRGLARDPPRLLAGRRPAPRPHARPHERPRPALPGRGAPGPGGPDRALALPPELRGVVNDLLAPEPQPSPRGGGRGAPARGGRGTHAGARAGGGSHPPARRTGPRAPLGPLGGGGRRRDGRDRSRADPCRRLGEPAREHDPPDDASAADNSPGDAKDAGPQGDGAAADDGPGDARRGPRRPEGRREAGQGPGEGKGAQSGQGAQARAGIVSVASFSRMKAIMQVILRPQ
jgi:Malate/L-lactate dehydrogenase